MEDPARAACRERCADVGDPPCYELEGSGPVDRPFVWRPCDDCLLMAGCDPVQPFDPDAAIGSLL